MGEVASIIGSALEAARLSAEGLGLMVEVIHEAWTGDEDSGTGDGALVPRYAPPVTLRAMVQQGAGLDKRTDQLTFGARAKVSFVGPVEPNGAHGRQEPIDPRDILTLPRGISGHIIPEAPGVQVDAATGQQFLVVVWLK